MEVTGGTGDFRGMPVLRDDSSTSSASDSGRMFGWSGEYNVVRSSWVVSGLMERGLVKCQVMPFTSVLAATRISSCDCA